MPPTAVQSPTTVPSSSELATSDRSLVGLAARGDEHAFERLFQRHRSGVHAYALRMLTDHAAAEDVVQEVFVSAMRSLRSGTQPVHVRAWLQEIARCACVDHWRGSERRREVSYDAPESLSGKDARQMAVSGDVAMRGAADRESLAYLQSAFEDLPPLQHRVLVQRELEGRSSSEIAERLGISPTVVEGQLARGRRSLAVSYRELQSGERCAATRELCETSLDRALGVRERARLRVHLRTCSSCRRHARAAGVEPRLFDPRVLGHLGFLLPLPLLRRFPLGSLLPSGESLGAAVAGKALVGAAVLAAGGGGALVMTDVGRERGTPSAPVVRPAASETLALAVDASPPRSRPSAPAKVARGATTENAPAASAGLRLAVAAPTTSRPSDPPTAPRESTGSRETESSVVPDVQPQGAQAAQPAPFTLPRFVPSTPPRVQRLAPAPGVDVGGQEPESQATAPEGQRGSSARNGKQLAALPDTKIGGEEGTEPEPQPDSGEQPDPEPQPEPDPEPEPEPRAEPDAEPEPDPPSATDPEPGTESESGPETTTSPTDGPAPEPEADGPAAADPAGTDEAGPGTTDPAVSDPGVDDPPAGAPATPSDDES